MPCILWFLFYQFLTWQHKGILQHLHMYGHLKWKLVSGPDWSTCMCIINQCCNKSSHWLGLKSTRVTFFFTLDLTQVFYLNDLIWLESRVKMTLTWLLTRPHFDSSQRVTWVMTHTRLSAWIMWSCEPWLCPHLILGEKIEKKIGNIT